MARGTHPNSLANLKKGKRFEKNDDSTRKAVAKSVEVRREFSSISEEMKALIDVQDETGASRRKALAAKLVLNMPKSPEWYKLGLRMLGELPPDQVELTKPDLSALERAFEDAEQEYKEGMPSG